MNPLSTTLLRLTAVIFLSAPVFSETKQLEVICTSNKDQTGDCRESNIENGHHLKALTCIKVSTNLIECGNQDSEKTSKYNCIKSLSISSYQQLFTCKLNHKSNTMEDNQFDPDEINADLLESKSYVKRENHLDSNGVSNSTTAVNSYMEEIITNQKSLQIDLTVDRSEIQNIFTYGH